VGFDIFDRNATAGASPLDLADVDTDLPRKTTDGRCCGHRLRMIYGVVGRGRSQGCGEGFLDLLLHSDRTRPVWGLLGSGRCCRIRCTDQRLLLRSRLRSVLGFSDVLGSRFLFLFIFLESDDLCRLAEDISRRHVNLGHGAGCRGRHLDGGLFGFDLDQTLVHLDPIADRDQDRYDVDAVNALSELGKRDGSGHGSSSNGRWVRGLSVDAELLDGCRHDLAIEPSLAGERAESGHHDVLGVDFEKAAQGSATV
jgi:hypothetical protein